MAAHRIRPAHLATLGALLITGACGSGGSNGSSGYDEGVHQRFVSACTAASSGRESACEAAYECIEQRVSFAHFKAADEAIGAGRQVDPEVAQVVAKCIAHSARG